jgi:hypothetical protein
MLTVPADRCAAPDRGRVKFAVRILEALQYTDAHPHEINKVGIAWCSDGHHFVANPKILGHHLGLRSNSVNTNFRDHGFVLCPCPVNQIIARFGNLPDPQNWKKRCHPEFAKRSTAADANRIALSKKRNMELITISEPEFDPAPERPARCAVPPILAPALAPFPRLRHLVAALIQKVDGDDQWKTDFLTVVAQDWISLFGPVASVSVDRLLESHVARESAPRLRANVEALVLSSNDRCSQKSERVEFDDYLLLMLRYGPRARLAGTLSDLTAAEAPALELSLDALATPQSQGAPRFQPWFHPELTVRTAEQMLRARPHAAWVLRPSSVPNMFTLHCKMLGRVMASHIRYDGLADEAYSVMLDNDHVQRAASWSDMLFRVLELSPGDALVSNCEAVRRQTVHVLAQHVIEGSREEMIMRFEPMHFGQSEER